MPKDSGLRPRKQFTSEEFNALMKKYNIKHCLTAPYNPTANSIGERINQTIAKVLKCNPQETLHKCIYKMEQSLNHSYHRILGGSLHEIVFGFSKLDPLRKITNKDSKDNQLKRTAILERRN